jgi:hypothetical protein
MELQDNEVTAAPTPELKTMPVMLYTSQNLIWGSVQTSPAIRVSTWMQTEMAPVYMKVIDAQMLMIGGGSNPKPSKYSTLFVHTDQLVAYHIMPPADESPYYDPDEPNRIMEPIAILVGSFRFDGFVRISDQSSLESYLGVAKSEFLAVFDVTMSCPVLPAIQGVRAPQVLIRQNFATFIPSN